MEKYKSKEMERNSNISFQEDFARDFVFCEPGVITYIYQLKSKLKCTEIVIFSLSEQTRTCAEGHRVRDYLVKKVTIPWSDGVEKIETRKFSFYPEDEDDKIFQACLGHHIYLEEVFKIIGGNKK